MSKEIEAFGRITLHTEYDNNSSYDCLNFEDDCKLVEQALTEYEAIKKQEPNDLEKKLDDISYFIMEAYEDKEPLSESMKKSRDCFLKYCDEIKIALLQQNAEPTKALECLENFIEECKTEMYNYAELQNGYQYEKYQYRKEQLENIKQALIQAEQDKKDLELVEKVRSGKTLIFVGKGLVMMNADKYHEYLKMEKEPISKKIKKCLKEQAWEIIKKKPCNSGLCINYLKVNKHYPNMQDYEHYCMTIREVDRVNEEEFNTLKENVNENN